MYYYLVLCPYKNSNFLDGNSYAHIKSHADGTKIAIMSSYGITHENVILKTKQELQVILDEWVDNENEVPCIDIDGNDMIQKKIKLR